MDVYFLYKRIKISKNFQFGGIEKCTRDMILKEFKELSYTFLNSQIRKIFIINSLLPFSLKHPNTS